MNNFKLTDSLNKNKVFLVNRSEIEGRLDPFYYKPEYMQVEKVLKKLGAVPLRKYVLGIASGATPKTDEVEKYYSNKENGIPFLRVQNLSPTSILNFEDCKYINQETHNGMLKRSQVNEGDLLVKITGVGRMAIASVAPKGFVGNTNQHMCVIKTNSEETSKIIAAWLNTDIAEKLASRRTTGGTRPALDYPALLSIPIIYDENILSLMTDAIKKMNEKVDLSNALLKSIDSYLLNELGIELPKNDNSLKARIFTTKFSDVCGGRLDPLYMVSANILHSRKYSQQKLSEVCSYFSSGFGAGKEDQKNAIDGIIQIRPTNIDENCDLKFDKNIYVDEHQNISKIEKTDVLFNNTNSQELVGKTALGELAEGMYYSNHITVIKTIQSELNPLFLKETLNLLQREKVFFSICTNWNNQSGVGLDLLKTISIPLPPLSKQIEIAEHIKEIRLQAKQLEIESEQILTDAKKEIEKMILGE